MIGDRQFARLRRGSEPTNPTTSVVPDDGMCLSVFLLIRPAAGSGRVLLGRIDPAASWWELGALDPSRVAAVGNFWMLPSSQLLLFESPEEAASRVAREQLAAPSLPLEGPTVFSETYRRPASRSRDPHWDLHFVFRGRWTSDRPPRVPVWKELAFVDLATLSPSEIARNQGDVLALAGLPPRGPGRWSPVRPA